MARNLLFDPLTWMRHRPAPSPRLPARMMTWKAERGSGPVPRETATLGTLPPRGKVAAG